MLCPICDSKANFKMNNSFNKEVYQCQNTNICGHLFLKEFNLVSGVCDRGDDLTNETIANIRNTRLKLFSIRNKKILTFIWDQLGLKDNARVLDYGAGDGHIMYSLREIQPNAYISCIEPHNEFAKSLNEFVNEVIKNVKEAKNKYDLIIMNEVIEHLTQPVEELKSLKKVLNPNGAIFIATPLGATHTGSYETHAYNTESHLHFFTRKSLSLCCIRSGLTPLEPESIEHPNYSYNTNDSTFNPTKKARQVLKNMIQKRYKMLPPEHICGLTFRGVN